MYIVKKSGQAFHDNGHVERILSQLVFQTKRKWLASLVCFIENCGAPRTFDLCVVYEVEKRMSIKNSNNAV
jgi:hypothetical protein